MGCVLALGLTTYIHAESYYSAKDPSVPYPFNPHPELETVEVSPGIFAFDDTLIPDTPEQAVSRKLRQAAAEHARQIAASPVLAKAEQEKREAAQAASFAVVMEEVSPWLHAPIKMPDGTPADSFQTLMDTQAMDFSANADAVIQDQQTAKEAALTWAAAHDLPTRIPLANGSSAYLMNIEDGVPNYVGPFDVAAGVTISATNLWPGGPTGFNLDGTNTTISMWDEASPRLTHLEFGARVTMLDGVTNRSDHSTAVAGMLAGNGAGIFAARGSAYAALVQARDFNGDRGEMIGAVGTNQTRLSNHSYGSYQGWVYDSSGGLWYWLGNPEIAGEDPKFGNYTTNAAGYDTITQNAPTYLTVWSAGNALSNGPTSQPITHVEINLQQQGYFTNAVRTLDGDQGGFDCLAQQAGAKNILTVGAISALTNGFTSPTNVVLGSFSSCGPTDDGRIKPDVVADGVNNLTPISYTNDVTYYQWSGTSFAAPSVTGAIDLLMQFHKQLNPNAAELLASTRKGLVIHTADSATTNAGPSYRFGWGVVNALSAATLINQNATNGLKNQIKEVLLTNGTSIQFPIVALGGTNRLKVTICWTDPAGVPNSITNLDNPAIKLINDLDLRLVAPDGTTNFPWTLNPDLTNKTATARSAAATTGDDIRNNVEQVSIAQPTNATYLVQVTHKGNLQSNATQWVSILLSGNVPQPAPPLTINQIVQTATNQLAIGWPAVVGQTYQVQSLAALATTNWATVDGIISARLTNVVVSVPLNATNSQQFYRVVQLP